MVKKVEGLAHTMVSEFQNFKHFIEENELKLEDKLSEWREHAKDFPE